MSVQTLIKQPSESRLFAMDFSGLLGVGETLTAVTSAVASPSGLTVDASPTATGAFAYVRISGGTADIRYKVTFVVTTSASNTLEGEGYLSVKAL